MGYLDAGKKSIANKVIDKINAAKGKLVEESIEDDSNEYESSNDVFCVL